MTRQNRKFSDRHHCQWGVSKEMPPVKSIISIFVQTFSTLSEQKKNSLRPNSVNKQKVKGARTNLHSINSLYAKQE